MINTDSILSLRDEDFFKFWMDLYQNKPELFEQTKDAVMKKLISRAPIKIKKVYIGYTLALI